MHQELSTFICFARKLAVILALGSSIGAASAAVEFHRQTIAVPADTNVWQGWRTASLLDVDEDGLLDLLVLGSVEHQLWIYRQHAHGFSPNPDQTLNLPNETIWLALADVAPHPGLELVLSTPGGLSYLQQDHGIFESQPRPLLPASQVFTNAYLPRLVQLARQTNSTNALLPLISAATASVALRNAAGNWLPGPPQPLRARPAQWSLEPGQWTLGSAAGRTLEFNERFMAGAGSEGAPEQKADQDKIGELLRAWRKQDPGPSQHWDWVDHIDVNGDGREDLVLSRQAGELDMKTDVHLFLRGTDNRLPEQPTQVLHCQGFPVQVHWPSKNGPGGRRFSPLCDLDGDGKYELVLAGFKNTLFSSSGLVDILLSGRIEWVLNIRTLHPEGFSRNPDASVAVTTCTPTEGFVPILIEGDFNGDGRTDILVQRSVTQWDILFSSANGWFASQPGLSVEVPLDGRFEIRDLNHDGLSDLLVQAYEQPKLFLFLSQSSKARP